MAKKLTIPVRVAPDFQDFLREVSFERFRQGKDKVPLKLPRLTKAITRIPKLKELMVNSEIKN